MLEVTALRWTLSIALILGVLAIDLGLAGHVAFEKWVLQASKMLFSPASYIIFLHA